MVKSLSAEAGANVHMQAHAIFPTPKKHCVVALLHRASRLLVWPTSWKRLYQWWNGTCDEHPALASTESPRMTRGTSSTVLLDIDSYWPVVKVVIDADESVWFWISNALLDDPCAGGAIVIALSSSSSSSSFSV